MIYLRFVLAIIAILTGFKANAEEVKANKLLATYHCIAADEKNTTVSLLRVYEGFVTNVTKSSEKSTTVEKIFNREQKQNIADQQTYTDSKSASSLVMPRDNDENISITVQEKGDVRESKCQRL